MSTRQLFSLLRGQSTTPYIRQEATHRSIHKWIDSATGGDALVVTAPLPRAGVTRTLEEMCRELGVVQFRGRSEIAPIVLDLAKISHLQTPEFLVATRNAFIEDLAAHPKFEWHGFDRYFLAFDAVWLLWVAAEFANDRPPRELALSPAIQKAKIGGKLGVSFLTLGAFDALVAMISGVGAAVQLSGFAKDAAEVGFEAKKEGWTSSLASKISKVAIKSVGSMLDPKTRRRLALGKLSRLDLEALLPELFVEATAKIVSSFNSNTRCLLIVDAADEVEGSYPELDELRMAICALITGLKQESMNFVVGTRGGAPPWPGELEHAISLHSLALPDLGASVVRTSWRDTVDDQIVEDVIAEVLPLGRLAAPAGEFSAAYRRAVVHAHEKKAS